MKMFSQFGRALIVAAGLLLASTANAGLIGQTVTFSLLHPGPNGSASGSATGEIADGTTFGPLYIGQITATFSDSGILFAGQECCQFVPDVYYRVSGADLGITGVLLNSAASNQPGLTQQRISFDANNIYVNVGGLVLAPEYRFMLDVDFANEGEVPEPGSIALLGAAAAGMALARRRRAARP